MTKASIIIPTYKRTLETIQTINHILASNKYKKDFDLEIIVADSTENDAVKQALRKHFGNTVRYIKPQITGIAANKNKGARIAKHKILIFCDTDIRVEKNTIKNTLLFLQQNKTAAGLGGTVIWHGSEKHGKLDRPRPEDRRKKIKNTTYIEALYSRYFATYKKVFFAVGGYDSKVFNMRGEGSDLSIRYWRAGYPLAYDSKIRVKHIYNAPNSAALRVSHPGRGIAKDLLLLAYKYDMLNNEYKNFINTVGANFKPMGQDGYAEIIYGIGEYLDFITAKKSIIDKQKKKLITNYDFKFLEIFSSPLFKQCITKASAKLNTIKKEAHL